jgi:hypothetical protein
MIQIAISVAVVAWAVIASLLALRNGIRLKQEMANNTNQIALDELLKEVEDFKIRNAKEIQELKSAAQKRGSNGQYIKK